jgi:metal-responsive CopG/Arc/MetJ family transcriptional regulator
MKSTCKPVGISIPSELLDKIDRERGDVSRSRYVLRMIEQYYYADERKKKGSGRSEPL